VRTGRKRPVISVVGWTNAGKTTLVERLVAELTARGLAIGTIKATHHDIDPDPPGKDSWRHRRAGAVETLLIGPRRWVLTREGNQTAQEALARLGPVDLVVVEGLRGEQLPKIEVLDPGSSRPSLAGIDPQVVLVAADVDPGDPDVPWRHRDDIEGIADFVQRLHQSGDLITGTTGGSMAPLPPVSRYMDTNVPTLNAQMEILTAVDFLIARHVTGAPVVDAEGRMVGILTEKDCLRLLTMGTDEGEVPNGTVSDFMTAEVVTIGPRVNIYHAAGLFLHHNFRRLIVVEDGKLIGAITRFDILRAVSENHKLVGG